MRRLIVVQSAPKHASFDDPTKHSIASVCSSTGRARFCLIIGGSVWILDFIWANLILALGYLHVLSIDVMGDIFDRTSIFGLNVQIEDSLHASLAHATCLSEKLVI